jgi:hypothetical protein
MRIVGGNSKESWVQTSLWLSARGCFPGIAPAFGMLLMASEACWFERLVTPGTLNCLRLVTYALSRAHFSSPFQAALSCFEGFSIDSALLELIPSLDLEDSKEEEKILGSI